MYKQVVNRTFKNEKPSLNCYEDRMMKGESLNRLLGKQCKIVTKEQGDEKNHIVIGVIKEIEYDEKFIIIESSYGIGYPTLQSIVAIKPRQQGNINEENPI